MRRELFVLKGGKIMPNWVINKVELEGEGVECILKSHLTKDERGIMEFDLNTIERMPDDLRIEKSSRSVDGLKLYISRINPLMSDFGKKEEKILPFAEWAKEMLSVFGSDCMDKIDKYILRSSEISKLRMKYGKDFESVIELGKKVYDNMKKYGTLDWYEWSCRNWGTKWNACNTYLPDDGRSACFDTAWSPSIEAIEKLARLHPDIHVIHKYAEEQSGFMSGFLEYRNGELVNDVRYDPFSKEAFEMSFELWNNGNEYEYDEESGTYEYVGE